MISGQSLASLLLAAIVRAGLYTLTATGLSLIFGVMNVPNFAHGELYMIGAYIAVFSFAGLNLPPLVAILLAAILGFILGAIIEKSFFYPLRQRSKRRKIWIMNTFLVTVGLSLLLKNLIQAIAGTKYRGIDSYWQGGLKVAGISISVDRLVGVAIAAVVVLAFWLFLQKTTIGKAIRATAQDETGAKVVGIDLNNIHTLTFALSAMLASIAGASLLSLNPAYPTMGLMPLFSSWFVVILVGLGNIASIPVGALIISLIETFAAYSVGSGWQRLFSLALIIIILLFKPRGLFGSDVKGVWER
ncbi:branched-chain amino acid ABC transporter permease [Candidatus Bipolaricaulota bacterium]|nr:branched-chain amino acid ABC transporter permease [Candidatus Bipolaricaulota bacterium]